MHVLIEELMVNGIAAYKGALEQAQQEIAARDKKIAELEAELAPQRARAARKAGLAGDRPPAPQLPSGDPPPEAVEQSD